MNHSHRKNFIYGNYGLYIGKFYFFSDIIQKLFVFGIGYRYNEFTLGTGWQGLARNCRVFPVTVAWSHFRDPERNSGLHLDLEAGVGFPEAKSNDIFYSGNIGFGYRIPVGCGLKMDCGVSLRTSYVHLYDLPDPDTHKPIPAENFRSSQTTVGALVFSIGLIF